MALLLDDKTTAEHFERSYLEGIARQLSSQSSLYGAELRFPNAPFWETSQPTISCRITV